MSLIISGILSLPPILVLAVSTPLVFVLSIPSLFLLTRKTNAKQQSSSTSKDKLRHVVITGGSSGIGLAIAEECVKQNAQNVTIIARDEKKLGEAKALLEKLNKGGENSCTIRTVSLDVVNTEAVGPAVAKLCDEKEDNRNNSSGVTATLGPPSILFLCAGFAHARTFTDLTPSDFQKLMGVNYLGSAQIAHGFLPRMMKSSTSSTIVFSSSGAGQVGVYGYSAYAPTKFALTGLAQVLDMELCESNVSVQVVYPPDTDTPGFAIEQQAKPEACAKISDTAGLWDPKQVGKRMIDEASKSNPSFSVYFGFEGWMLATLTAGMSPVNNVMDAAYQVSLMGLLRFVSLFYLMDFRGIVKNCTAAQESKRD